MSHDPQPWPREREVITLVDEQEMKTFLFEKFFWPSWEEKFGKMFC